MSDQAPAPAIDAFYFGLMGRGALDLGTRPKYKFVVYEGDRRRFGERTPGRADLKIISRKENTK